nr:hypothetical protein [Candidatus Levybacteria bacterium]
MKFLSIILLSFALLLETTLTTIPLVLISLLCLMVIYRENFLFLFGFAFGLFLDLTLFKTVGLSSLFFTVFLFLVLLYQKKFEIKTASFILIASFLGSLGFLLFMGYNNNVLSQAILSSIIGLVVFYFLKNSLIKNKFLISNF